MTTAFKPAGYNSVSPYIIANDCNRMAELLKGIFNAVELRKYDNADGKVMHMELKVDDSVIMAADSNDQYPPNQLVIHVYVPDVHATFRKAIELGCTAIQEPTNKPGDPDTRGTFKDYQGNMWSVSTQAT
jgi:uncharacterized glyoxalase superfamily protein PhnB